MCGIAGFYRPGGIDPEQARGALERMSATLRHRGPDSGGAWLDAEAGIALGHRRLSILDLSACGHQPMTSACGRYVVSFNGEIYNFGDLQSQLAGLGHPFRGHSDTEVLLAAVREWGLRGALDRFNGMFAFALWDRCERTLALARDRVGEKPLYCGWMDGTLLFGSELKALRAYPGFRAEIDRGALALFLRHNYVPAPHSIFLGINKLLPGTYLVLGGASASRDIEPVPYWSARDVAERGAQDPFDGTAEEAVSQLDALLRDAVGLRMVADVPLGAFLSGGIDSSLVVALMQAGSATPVETFTIGFQEGEYNEAEHAKAVARHLGTHHTELYVTPEQALGVIPLLPALYDEPFSDSSQIPTYLVSALARKHVTVSLSGDGGDELFGGYNRYLWASEIWKRIAWLPAGVRRALARQLAGSSSRRWNRALRFIPGVPRQINGKSIGERIHQIAEILGVTGAQEIYLRLVSHWRHSQGVVLEGKELPTVLTDRSRWAGVPEFLQEMMYWDLVSYLPDDILVKVDRASMGVSLEARVPLLDHRVVEFAWRLPSSLKVRDGEGKWLLRQVLHQYVPRELIDRPKMGFGVPIGSWLRGPLREWADALLDEELLRQQGYFDATMVRRTWEEHLSGEHHRHYDLWDVLMFQAWLSTAEATQWNPAAEPIATELAAVVPF